MKKIIVIVLVSLCNFLHAQNIIKNPGFENGILNPPLNANDPFDLNQIENWQSFIGSPEIFEFNNEREALLFGDIGNREGIFQDGLNLNPNYTYNFKLTYTRTGSAKIVVLLTNGLNANPKKNNTVDPTFLSSETLINGPGTINSKNYVDIIFQPNAAYDQIAIYALPVGTFINGIFKIDDLSITPAKCCPFFKDYASITNPPSINVQDYIRCSTDVVFSYNSNTYLAAKNEILLQNNTLITDVASFVATAEDCLAKPVELYTQIVQAKCKFKVFLSACYGSGQYEFYFGEELSENKVKDYSLVNAGSSITVKVKDLVSGLIVSKVITLPTNDSTLNPNPTKYKGAFTFNIGNVFTPNGDGINDVFRVIDSSKARFAYNAYAYKFWVWNRWGNNLLELEKEIPDDDINGFNDQEIFWNGRKWQNEGDMVNNGTYYYLLQFNNCTEAQIENDTIKGIRGTITLIKRNNFTEQTSIKEEINNNNFKSEIFPNPANGSIKLKLFVNDNNNPFLKITDIMGKEQLVKYTLIENKNGVIVYEIDCSQLNNGIYFCTIFKNNTTETIKFSIVK
jgi:hypothetical protein